MSLRFSTGLTNYIASGGGWGDALRNGIIKIYTGTQPTSANDAATGTLLAQFSTGTDGGYTAEVPCVAKVDFTSTTGNCTALTVGGVSIISGAVTYSTPTLLAEAVAANINSFFSYPDYFAVVGGSTVGGITYGSDAKIVYIISPKGAGASLNALTVACTVAAGTVAINGGSSSTLGGSGCQSAGANAVSCLSMSYPAVLGVIAKEGVWQDTSANSSGTAGWFRYIGTPYFDDGSTTILTTGNDSVKVLRLDGSVGSSGADMIISNTGIVAGASQTINQFQLTIA